MSTSELLIRPTNPSPWEFWWDPSAIHIELEVGSPPCRGGRHGEGSPVPERRRLDQQWNRYGAVIVPASIRATRC